MARLLYLVHRLPYPPNKGDKVRSFHLLQHLARQHEVLLGTFVDDPDDEQHVPTLRRWCSEMHVARLHPLRARVASLGALASGDALTLHYYHDAGLKRWVQRMLADGAVDAAVVFSSSMAQYVQDGRALPTLVDFVDVDSAKWTQYASHHAWPMSWLYRREGRRLLAYERAVAARAMRSFFVTAKEVALFNGMAPECAATVEPVGNGVDAEFFAPQPQRASPFEPDELPLVFTGAMDYWPNVDAVSWFVQEMLPALRARFPRLRFSIVGRSPTPAVRALAGDAVRVTGTVDDVRPYLQHAAAVVAPLRLARGVQNKILEAMAMGRAVVTTGDCASALLAEPGRELCSADTPDAFVQQLGQLLEHGDLASRIGERARAEVLARYSWQAHLSAFDRHLAQFAPPARLAAQAVPA